MQPRNNCWLVCQPTSSCSLPGSTGSGKARAGLGLLIPCQSAAPSHHLLHLQPGKALRALIISLPTKPSKSKPLALDVLELDPSNNQLQRLKKTLAEDTQNISPHQPHPFLTIVRTQLYLCLNTTDAKLPPTHVSVFFRRGTNLDEERS